MLRRTKTAGLTLAVAVAALLLAPPACPQGLGKKGGKHSPRPKIVQRSTRRPTRPHSIAYRRQRRAMIPGARYARPIQPRPTGQNPESKKPVFPKSPSMPTESGASIRSQPDRAQIVFCPILVSRQLFADVLSTCRLFLRLPAREIIIAGETTGWR
jgi:hypothetical protein